MKVELIEKYEMSIGLGAFLVYEGAKQWRKMG